jgi:beta-propeller repeat-containing protein
VRAGRRVRVKAAYRLSADVVGFRLGSYDRSLPLVLDPPGIVYAGYLGGSGGDAGEAIAVDQAGSVYVTGHTDSTADTFPVKAGPGSSFNGGEHDAFVAKVSRSGKLVYAGYIGGSRNDEAGGIAVDGTGSAYVTGSTSSNQMTFPVKGVPDPAGAATRTARLADVLKPPCCDHAGMRLLHRRHRLAAAPVRALLHLDLDAQGRVLGLYKQSPMNAG